VKQPDRPSAEISACHQKKQKNQNPNDESWRDLGEADVPFLKNGVNRIDVFHNVILIKKTDKSRFLLYE